MTFFYNRLVWWTAHFYEIYMPQKLVRWMVSASEEELFCIAASQGLVDIWSWFISSWRCWCVPVQVFRRSLSKQGAFFFTCVSFSHMVTGIWFIHKTNKKCWQRFFVVLKLLAPFAFYLERYPHMFPEYLLEVVASIFVSIFNWSATTLKFCRLEKMTQWL